MILTRRSFLSGAITLIAAVQFEPLSAGNLPRIFANGQDDDTAGLGALLRNEPLLFPRDKVAIESHRGVIFNYGRYHIEQTINVPETGELRIESATFLDYLPDASWPFFRVPVARAGQFCSSTRGGFRRVTYERPAQLQSGRTPGDRSIFIETVYPPEASDDFFVGYVLGTEEEYRKLGVSPVRTVNGIKV